MHLFVIANPEQEQLVWPEKNATKKKKKRGYNLCIIQTPL